MNWIFIMGNSSHTSAWQPIETAPKDGTVILAYIPKTHSHKTWMVSWSKTKLGEWGWFFELSWRIVGTGITHWQPLPEPPAPRAIGARQMKGTDRLKQTTREDIIRLVSNEYGVLFIQAKIHLDNVFKNRDLMK